MIVSLKALKKQMDLRADEEEIERDEEGRAVIEMTVLNDDDFLSDFSAGSRPVVSAEVAQFLDENAKAFRPKEAICLNIYSDCIDDEEQKIYKKALKEYYVRHYKENRRNLKRNAWISAVMAIVGVLALATVLTLSFFDKNPVFAEVVDIFAWVFIWEAVDLFFLQRSLLCMERTRCLRFIEARVNFLPRTQTKKETF